MRAQSRVAEISPLEPSMTKVFLAYLNGEREPVSSVQGVNRPWGTAPRSEVGIHSLNKLDIEVKVVTRAKRDASACKLFNTT